MSTQQTPLQRNPRARVGPREAPTHAAPPPVYPRSGYARKHSRLQEPPCRRTAGAENEPPDYGNAV